MGDYKRNKATLKPCRDVRRDCFAITEHGNCICLVNTNFKHYDNVCPFYKTHEEYVAGLKKYGATRSY